ncbi:MAG TPA: hypothetical protein VI298_04250 [Geobacteraceae bacterium]
MTCEPESHKEHMCALKATNNVELIECLSRNPTVQCGHCGAKADRPQNVCDPAELSEQ